MERGNARRRAAQLPLVKVRTKGEAYTPLLGTGAVESSVKKSTSRKAWLAEGNLRKEETFTCAGGRRLRVSQQARAVRTGTEGKQFRVDLLIADTNKSYRDTVFADTRKEMGRRKSSPAEGTRR